MVLTARIAMLGFVGCILALIWIPQLWLQLMFTAIVLFLTASVIGAVRLKDKELENERSSNTSGS